MDLQNDFEKVMQNIINPLKSLWGAQLDTFTVKAMVDDLSHFTENALQGGIKTLRKTRKKPPTLAEIIEACEACESSAARKSPAILSEDAMTAKADEVMKTPVGRYALAQGVGMSLWARVKRGDDVSGVGNGAIHKWKSEYLKGFEALISMKDTALKASLTRIHEAMEQREKDLFVRLS